MDQAPLCLAKPWIEPRLILREPSKDSASRGFATNMLWGIADEIRAAEVQQAQFVTRLLGYATVPFIARDGVLRDDVIVATCAVDPSLDFRFVKRRVGI